MQKDKKYDKVKDAGEGKMKQREEYLDILKGLAIIAVVYIHIVPENNTAKYIQKVVCGYAYSFLVYCIPVFLMVTGILLLDSKKDLLTKHYFKNRIFTIILAGLIFGFIYYLRDWIVVGRPMGDDLDVVRGLISFFVCDVPLHFWYVYMIVELYLIFPILKVFTDYCSKNQMKYFLTVWLLINMVHLLIIGLDIDFLNGFTNKFYFFGFFIGYVGYPVLGLFLKRYVFEKDNYVVYYVLGVISFLLMGLLHSNREKTGILSVQYTAYCSVFVALWSVSIVLYIKKHITQKDKKSIVDKLLLELGKNTLGIYFIHMMFVWMFPRKWNGLESVFVMLIEGIVVLTLSYVVTKLLKYIPGLKKII